MRILFLTLIALVVFITDAPAKAQETLKVRIGQTKTADRGKVRIKFVSVVEDSRCPIGTNCIWAGNAKIKIAVSKGKAAPKIIELSSGLKPEATMVYGYGLKFINLSPYPGETVKMAASPKSATISIIKSR